MSIISPYNPLFPLINFFKFFLIKDYRASLCYLSSIKNKHKEDRCFIIGNGPSLKNLDLSLLKKEITFGLNRIYLIFDKIDFQTTYFVCVNQLVIEQCYQEIKKIKSIKFINKNSKRYFTFSENLCYISCEGHPDSAPWFSCDIMNGICTGGTVTYVALQMAYYMGFKQVILIGIDHFFKTQGKPHQVVVTTDSDLNHFESNYFGKGFRWQLPDLEKSELSYRLAKHQFERNGREICDATIGGKLNVFRKIDYYDLFN